MWPARVHSSISTLTSKAPAFSEDHMLIAEYGREYISTFLPVKPWESLTISRLEVKMAVSRKVLKAAQGCSSRTSSWPTSQGIGTSAWNVHDVIAAVSMKPHSYPGRHRLPPIA